MSADQQRQTDRLQRPDHGSAETKISEKKGSIRQDYTRRSTIMIPKTSPRPIPREALNSKRSTTLLLVSWPTRRGIYSERQDIARSFKPEEPRSKKKSDKTNRAIEKRKEKKDGQKQGDRAKKTWQTGWSKKRTTGIEYHCVLQSDSSKGTGTPTRY